MKRTQRQKSRKHLFVTTLIGCVVVGVLFILLKGLSLNPSMVQSTLIGKPAKDFDVELLEGSSWLPALQNNKVKLSDLKGKPIILNFWASWCVSCREEAMYLETFWKRYREKGWIVLGIAIQDTAEAATEFAKVHGKTYPIALILPERHLSTTESTAFQKHL